MIMRNARLLVWCAVSAAWAQQYDLVMKGGHAIDPASGLDEVRVALTGHRIAGVAADIPESAHFSLPGWASVERAIERAGSPSAQGFPPDTFRRRPAPAKHPY